MNVFLLLLAVFAGASADLITIDPRQDITNIKACQDDTTTLCTVVKVDLSALEDQELTLPEGTVLTRKDAPGQHSATFANLEGAEATFSTSDGDVYGDLELADGSMYVIEPCSDIFPGCHVLIRENLDVLSALETNEENEWALLEDQEAGRAPSYVMPRVLSVLKQQGIDDLTTVVTYSLKVYYTQEFMESTQDIPLFVDQVANT